MVKIYIQNEIGQLNGFSDIYQPDCIAIEIENRELFNFKEYRFDGKSLIKDITNMPVIEEEQNEFNITKGEYISIIQENAELKRILEIQGGAIYELGEIVASLGGE